MSLFTSYPSGLDHRRDICFLTREAGRVAGIVQAAFAEMVAACGFQFHGSNSSRRRAGWAAIQNRLHNLRCQQRRSKQPADVGGVDLLGGGNLLEGPVDPGFPQLAPTKPTRDRLGLMRNRLGCH